MIGVVFIMILWSLLFSLAMTVQKMLPPETSSFLVISVRSMIGLFIVGPMMWSQHNFSWALWKTKQIKRHALRLVFAIIAVFSTYYAYRHLPLAVASGLGMTGPLFATIFSRLLLKEKLSNKTWMFLGVGYVGVICVVQSLGMNRAVMWNAVAISLLGNILGSLSFILSRKLVASEPPARLFLYANLMQGLCFGSSTFFVTHDFSYTPWMYIVAIGILGSLSNVCHVIAVKRASPSFLAPFDYTRLCFSAIWGFLFFQEWPTYLAWIGYALIIGAVFPLTQMRLRLSKSS